MKQKRGHVGAGLSVMSSLLILFLVGDRHSSFQETPALADECQGAPLPPLSCGWLGTTPVHLLQAAPLGLLLPVSRALSSHQYVLKTAALLAFT